MVDAFSGTVAVDFWREDGLVAVGDVIADRLPDEMARNRVATEFVLLEEFTKKEKEYLDSFVDEAASCCLMWLREGIEAAMDQHNRKK